LYQEISIMSNMDQHDDRAEQPSSQDEVTTTPAPHPPVSEQGAAPFNPPYPQISPYPPNTPYPQMSPYPPDAQYAQYPQLTYYPPMQPYPASTKHKGKTRSILLIVDFVLAASLIITGVLLAFINKAKGNTMVVAINNHVVSSYTDTTNPFTTGYLALMVGNAKGSPAQQVNFTHIDVYPAPSQLPGLNS
jgi:hypothetical protein